MHCDIKYVKKRNHREKNKQKHMPSFLVQLWFFKFFFTSFHTLQMLYKRDMRYFDVQDKKATNGRNNAPLCVMKEELEFGHTGGLAQTCERCGP